MINERYMKLTIAQGTETFWPQTNINNTKPRQNQTLIKMISIDQNVF